MEKLVIISEDLCSGVVGYQSFWASCYFHLPCRWRQQGSL